MAPATFGDLYLRKPPLNAGSPKAPPPPPPAMAPPRADMQSGEEDAARLAARRKGLRRTMLQELMGTQSAPGRTLGAPTALGSFNPQQH